MYLRQVGVRGCRPSRPRVSLFVLVRRSVGGLVCFRSQAGGRNPPAEGPEPHHSAVGHDGKLRRRSGRPPHDRSRKKWDTTEKKVSEYRGTVGEGDIQANPELSRFGKRSPRREGRGTVRGCRSTHLDMAHGAEVLQLPLAQLEDVLPVVETERERDDKQQNQQQRPAAAGSRKQRERTDERTSGVKPKEEQQTALHWVAPR